MRWAIWAAAIGVLPLIGACSDGSPSTTAPVAACTDLQASKSAAVTTECLSGAGAGPSGGALNDGTYVLTHRFHSDAGCESNTTTLHETLRITGHFFELSTQVESSKAGAGLGSHAENYSAVESGGAATSLTLTPTCVDGQTVEQGLGAGTFTYSSTPTEIRFFAVYSNMSQLVAVYKKT
jgi:hypothetical protein